MTWLLTAPLLALCLIGAGWSALTAARDRRPSDALLTGLTVLELAVLAQLLVAVVSVVRGEGHGAAVFLLYAIVEPLVLPVGVFWSAAEKSRSSTLVITLGCVAVGVMSLRMVQVWGGHG